MRNAFFFSCLAVLILAIVAWVATLYAVVATFGLATVLLFAITQILLLALVYVSNPATDLSRFGS